MSKAYICDKCGRILSELAEGAIPMNPIWIRNPYLYDPDERNGIAAMHLCEECYADFKREYMANLTVEGGLA